MNARPDFALCPVGFKSCTHHAHCARAQLSPHPTRQAWFTPNRRGDECMQFSPIEAYTLPATENLGRTVTANEAHTSGDAQNQRTADTGAAARETAGESGAGPISCPAADNRIMVLFKRLRAKLSVDTLERHWPRILDAYEKRIRAQQLHAARTIFGRQP